MGTLTSMLKTGTEPTKVREDTFSLREFLKVRMIHLQERIEEINVRIEAYNRDYFEKKDNPAVTEDLMKRRNQLLKEKHALWGLPTAAEQAELLKKAEARVAENLDKLPVEMETIGYPEELGPVDSEPEMLPDLDKFNCPTLEECRMKQMEDLEEYRFTMLQRYIGVNNSTMNNYCNGSTRPERNNLIAMAFVLKLPAVAAQVVFDSLGVPRISEDSPRDCMIIDGLKNGWSLKEMEAQLSEKRQPLQELERKIEILKHDAEQIVQKMICEDVQIQALNEKLEARKDNRKAKQEKCDLLSLQILELQRAKPDNLSAEQERKEKEAELDALKEEYRKIEEDCIRKETALLDLKKEKAAKIKKIRTKAINNVAKAKPSKAGIDADLSDEEWADIDKLVSLAQERTELQAELNGMQQARNTEKLRKEDRNYAPLLPEAESLSELVREALKVKGMTFEQLVENENVVIREQLNYYNQNHQEEEGFEELPCSVECLDVLRKHYGQELFEREEVISMCVVMGLKKEMTQRILMAVNRRKLRGDDPTDKVVLEGLEKGWGVETINQKLRTMDLKPLMW